MSDTHNEYSEFMYSNWFAYWMKGMFKDKQKQQLVLWYIGHPNFGVIEYTAVKNCIAAGNIKASIPFASELSETDSSELDSIYESFVMDVDRHHIDTVQ